MAAGDDARDVSGRGWFRDLRGFRGLAISDYTVPLDARHPVIAAAQSVHGDGHAFRAVLAASIRPYCSRPSSARSACGPRARSS